MARRLALTLVTVGLCLLGLAASEVVERVHHQAAGQRQLEAALRAGRHTEGGSGQAFGARMRASRGEAWGRLEIGRVGLSAVVDEGVDRSTLRSAVGHLPETPFPGETGNVVLAGHRDGLFRPLRLVRKGDRVRLTTLDGVFEYQVEDTSIVAPERTEVLRPGPRAQLTLLTCYPFGYIGAAPLRYVVKATALGSKGSTAAGSRSPRFAMAKGKDPVSRAPSP